MCVLPIYNLDHVRGSHTTINISTSRNRSVRVGSFYRFLTKYTWIKPSLGNLYVAIVNVFYGSLYFSVIENTWFDVVSSKIFGIFLHK